VALEKLTHQQRGWCLDAFGKLSHTVYILATGPGDVRSRLRDCFFDLAQAAALVAPLPLPEDIAGNFRWIFQSLRKEQDEFNWKSVEARTRAMKNRTGVAIAERIVSTEARFRSHLETLGREREVKGDITEDT